MGYTKTILCLANSHMWDGRCVAGKEVLSGGRLGNWIRPVNTLKHKGIPEEKADSFSVLDFVQIPLLKAASDLEYQPENYLIDKSLPWKLVGRASWRDITGAIDPVPGALWKNGYHSQNDRIPAKDMSGQINHSLVLIKPKDLIVCLAVSRFKPKPQVRAKFSLNGERYNLSITDPVIEQGWRAIEQRGGSVERPQAFLCVSLGKVSQYDGCAYKLVATVITPKTVRQKR